MPRVRSTAIGYADNPCTWTNWVNGSAGAVNNYGSVLYDDYKQITDDVTPNYGKIVQEGAFRPINSTTIRHHTYTTYSVCSGRADYLLAPPGTNYHIGTLDPYIMAGFTRFAEYVPSSSDIDHVVIQALSRAKSPDWDPLTFIGELPSTVDLLKTNFTRLKRIADRMARKAREVERKRAKKARRPFSLKKATDKFNDLWLEARYGWRPLVYDINSILAALHHKTQVGVARRTYSKTFEITKSENQARLFAKNCNVTTQKTRTGTCKIRAVVFYLDDMSAIGVNPARTAWELTRFSFVVDWFVDIGSWIDSISPRVGYTGLGISVSTTSKYTDVYLSQVANVTPTNYTWAVTDAKREHKFQIYNRYKYVGVPLPSIQVNLNVAKLVDLAALALTGYSNTGSRLRL